MEKLKCLRCGVEMEFVGREKIQLGQTGWLLGDLGNLIAGALETAIFTCPKCGKLEFFRGDLERGSVGTLSTSQFISIFTVIIGVGMLIRLLYYKGEEKR